MKRIAVLLTILFTCLSLFSINAEARRMGGGSSFGKQRAVPMQPQRSPDAAPRQASPAPAQTPPAQPQRNRWLGPLAGLAIGAGLGALFANTLGGSGGSLLLILVAAGILLFLIRRLLRPRQPQLKTAHGPAEFRSEPGERPRFEIPPIGSGSATANGNPAASPIPADFPVDSFLRGAKATFIRLQAANDRKDLDDIREYTTPEVFAEISMQVQERGDASQKTDVLELNADLLEAVTEGNLSIASVRYTGRLSENGGPAEYFDEIWHVQRDLRNPKSGWLLAGIQQAPGQ